MWLYGSGFPKSMDISKQVDKKGGNDYSNQWQGWGTCLKPAFEPIIVARKPFKGSLVDNVIKWGVGGINIDECRVEAIDKEKLQKNWADRKAPAGFNGDKSGIYGKGKTDEPSKYIPDGRFPANLILTYEQMTFDEVCGGFPETNGGTYKKQARKRTGFKISGSTNNIQEANAPDNYGDSGSASRYFYCAKASKKDRDEGLDEFEEIILDIGDERPSGGSWERRTGKKPLPRKNIHPTVKPTSLMQYLVRLVTPENGIILDPFMGSGSTGKACMYENLERNKNYSFIGIEKEQEYYQIAKARIEYVERKLNK